MGSLAVISETPVATALAAVRNLQRQAVLFAVVIIIVALGMTILVSHRIIAPLRHLQVATEKVAKGNLGIALPVGGTTEVAALTETFNRMSSRLQDRESRYLGLVGTLGGGVAHEINNPLAALMINQEFVAEILGRVVGAAEHNEAPVPAAELRNALDALLEAQEAARRVKGIVSDLRAFSEGPDEETEVVELSAVLDSAIRLVQEEIRFRAQLVRSYAPVPPVAATRSQLSQVIVNLLINAAHSIPEGDADHNTIRVATSSHELGVAIEVSDTGRGFPAEVVDRIFDPFYTTSTTGSRVGLAISHSIVTRLGGRISLESRVGVGTVVRLVLPAASSAPAEPRYAALTAPVGRPRVLVVDDDPAIGSIVRRLLEIDHDVEVRTSGREALALLEEGAEFDVVLCDLLMPNLTGMDFYEAVRRKRPELGDRIAFMSGAAFTERSEKFVIALADRFIDKPFTVAELRSLVARMVRRRRGGGV
jgi:signal transduction histidine kinase/CheY-like chemotaxis protein